MGFGYMLVACYLLYSLKYGSIAPANPWNAYGLEWLTTSPPPTENFAETPIVTREAYDYGYLDRDRSVRATDKYLHSVDLPSVDQIVHRVTAGNQ